MNAPLLNKRIPTLFALVLLMGGLGVASFLANTTLRVTGLASPEERPENIRITNVTDSTLTISYTTEKAMLGVVSYGTSEPLTQTVLDEAGDTPGTTHSFTLTNLTPSTTYQFFITSGENDFLNDGNPFVTTTAGDVEGAQVDKTITGSVQNTEGQPVRNALVYVNAEGTQTFSTRTNDNGDFSLRLTNVLSDTLTSAAELTDESTMQMIVVTNNATSSISFLLGTTHLPSITLAQNYDFTLGKPILLPETPPGDAASSFPILPGTPIERGVVEITTPSNGETFTDPQPEFTGIATPNTDVQITIQSEEQKATVRTNQNGEWSYRPETALTPGEHTITITTRDEGGILRTITRSFTVFAEGSQFIEPSVSPSAPSPTPSSEPLAEPTLTASPTPTGEPEATPTLVIAEISPTSTPLPTLEPSPTITPRPTVQPTGSGALVSLSIFSLAIVGLGAILLLFARHTL